MWSAALATFLGLWGTFGKMAWDWWKKPKLSIDTSGFRRASGLVGNRWHFRLPVMNAGGKKAATKSEIFLEAIEAKNLGGEKKDYPYFPMRMQWCHGVGPVCDRIAGGASNLFDLGVLSFVVDAETGFLEAVTTDFDKISPAALELATAVSPSDGPVLLPVGSYALHFLIVCDGAEYRQKITLTVRHREYHEGTRPQDFIEVEG